MTQSMSLWMLVQAALDVRRGPDRGRQANSPPPAETGVGQLGSHLGPDNGSSNVAFFSDLFD